MKRFFLAVSAACTVSFAVAQSDVANFFNELHTYSADFSQTVTQDGNIVQQSLGTVWLKKPLKFRWDYDMPEKMQLISDGERFYHYDIELAQATVKPVQEITGSALVTLLNDKAKLDETFIVKSFGAPALKRQFPQYADSWLEVATLFYLLTPKEVSNEDNAATQVILGITPARELTVFYAEDAYGENVFLFNNVKQNTAIADKQFRFKAPKGVDVLGE